jgi:hypothetical protein
LASLFPNSSGRDLRAFSGEADTAWRRKPIKTGKWNARSESVATERLREPMAEKTSQPLKLHNLMAEIALSSMHESRLHLRL